ncbi:hypothetical protein BDZ97DRAFT_1597382, partial [Flammula alnicola]
IKQFDVQKKATGEVSNEEDEDIRELAGDSAYDSEEHQTREGLLEESLTGEVGADDDVTGWIDEMAALSAVDRAVLQESIRPVKKLLVKVQKLAFKTINSTTLLLPAWQTLLEELDMDSRIIPRDVTTRWNSTYDMLIFILEYRKAVDKFTSDRKNDIRELEISEEEWKIVEQLTDVLMV